MGWYVAGPLALKNAKSFFQNDRHFLEKSMPGSGSQTCATGTRVGGGQNPGPAATMAWQSGHSGIECG